MASVKNLRALFKNTLQILDPEYREHDDAFAVDNIGRHNFDKSFHISYYRLDSEALSHEHARANITLKVVLGRKGFRDPQEAADDLFDFANLYRTTMMEPKDYTGSDLHILKLVGRNLEISGIDTNDNSIQAVLEFDVDSIFGTNINQDCS
jgi:hypothetical protein